MYGLERVHKGEIKMCTECVKGEYRDEKGQSHVVTLGRHIIGFHFFRGFQVCEEKRSSFFNYNLIEPESGILSLLDITDIYQK